MKKLLFGALVAGVALAAAPRVASAFSDAAVVNVPFEFMVNRTVLPAGSYRITADVEDPTLIYIASMDGRHAAVAAAVALAPNEVSKVEVEFKQSGGERYLWKIDVPGDDSLELAAPPAAAVQTLARAGR